ncbi:MAG: hypothetical protein IJ093_03740 [Bacilli bacterium]|nr:hypothetical protein [Bacilli bacterium]
MIEKNAELILDYMIYNGFNEENYTDILEIISSANESMSQFLSGYRQYLLSRRVRYDDLNELELDGAYGYLGKTGIIVPQNYENDRRFLFSSECDKNGRYLVPTINNFNAIIGHGISKDILNVANYPHDKFLGLCIDMDDEELSKKIKLFELITKQINFLGNDEYRLSHDTVSNKNKELLLINKVPSKTIGPKVKVLTRATYEGKRK